MKLISRKFVKRTHYEPALCHICILGGKAWMRPTTFDACARMNRPLHRGCAKNPTMLFVVSDPQCYEIIKIVQSQLGKYVITKKRMMIVYSLWGNQQYWYFHKMYLYLLVPDFLEHCIYTIGRIEYYEESICEVVDVSDTVKMWVESTNSIFFVPNLFYFFWNVLLL